MKRSLSPSFLSKESVTQRHIIVGWKLGEFKSLMHRATSFSSRALQHETKKPLIKNEHIGSTTHQLAQVTRRGKQDLIKPIASARLPTFTQI